jgi:hypothetical protein
VRCATLIAAALTLAGPAASQQYAPKDILISGFERQKVILMRYIDLIPDDKMDFVPIGGLRTYAGQMAHIAQVAGSLLAQVAQHGQPPRGDSTFYLRNKSALKDFVTRNYDFAIAGVQALRPVQMVAETEMDGLRWPNWKWILSIQEHTAWILGAAALYLRLNGVQAPEYLPF